ncbi:MAG TPA: tripartite tricarboxylate transporter substrate binding protein [Burkholderiales bacterium]|nr:tripartite tricarboxylate transporter substrate binding protein [Burkholderiales bacterium]
MNFNMLFGMVLLALTIAGPRTASAQSYPAKAVRIVVPFPPGAGADIVTRLITAKLGSAFGQQFVVDNRAGAAGHIGAEVAAHAAPDGYTLLSTPASIVISRSLYPKLNYDIEKDLDPVVLIASAPFVLVVHPSLPARNVRELIALARAKPGELYYASTGNGGTPHLATEIFKMQAKIDIVHVPYKGTPPAVTDLLSGQVQLMFANTLSVLPHVRSGRLRALAISSSKRSAAAPELPTVAESGMPGFDVSTWFGMLAPRGTPKEIIDRLDGEVRKIVQMADVRARLISQGADPIGSTPEEFRAYLKSELVKWEKAVKAVGVRIE